MKTAEEKAIEYLDEISGNSLGSPINAAYSGFIAGYSEAMRWRDPEVELPEFNKKDYFNGDYKRYLIRVVEGSISTRKYVTVGWLISANRWNAEMDWVAVIGWRPIE